VKLRTLAPGLVFLATLVALGALLERGGLRSLLSEDWIDREVRGQGVGGQLLFVAAGGVATAIAVPRHVVSFLGGYAFGAGSGSLLALAATELGCALTFAYGRLVGRPLLGARFGARVRRIDAFLAGNPFAMSLLVRLLPLGNNFATSLAAGVSSVRPGPFLAGSLIGYYPLTLAFALAGSGVEVGGAPRVALAVALLLASAALGVWLYHRYRRGRTLGAEVDDALDERG